MSYSAYIASHERKGQAPSLATWNSENASILGASPPGSRLSVTVVAARRATLMPHSRPMPSIGPHCHELRIADSDKIWRIVYRIDVDAIVIAEVFQKKTAATPKPVIDICKFRFGMYDDASK